MSKKIEYKFYKLTFPNEFTVEQSLDFFDTVATSLKRNRVGVADETMVLELWSDKNGITHRFGIPWQRSELPTQLGQHLTGIHIAEHERTHIPNWSHIEELGVNDGTRPFNIGRVEAQSKRILGSFISDMKPDDTLVMQWVVSAADRIAPPSTTKPVMTTSWAQALLAGRQADRDELSERRQNAAQSQFRSTLRIAASSSTTAHAEKLVQNVKNALRTPETASVHFVSMWWTRPHKRAERLNKALPLVAPIHFINATELAAFSGWPIGTGPMPGLSLGKTRYLPPNAIIAKEGRRLGMASAFGYEKTPIAVTAEGATRHTYVIGPSGFGKTTLLGNNLQQDIERGHGVIVFDGKGDLINRGLDSIPRERVNDVVYLNFADHEYPIGFNILLEGDPRSVVDDLMNLFLHNAGQDIYLREVLYHGLHTMREARLTVVDLLPFLHPPSPKEEAWRAHIISQLPRSSWLAAYWKAFDSLKPTERKQKIQPVQNRLWQITNRADLRNMLGQSESTISIRDILRDDKILLVSIPQNLGNETVGLLGSIIFDAIWQQVQALNMKTPTHLYIDEVQRFLSLPIDLTDMLSTARSKNFDLTMAHQYTAQLSQELFAAVTNASTKIAFKLEGPDASKMQNLFGKAVTAEDFINLDKYEVLARVAVPGGSSEPLTIKTFEAFEGHGLSERIIEQSRKTHARRADEVAREIELRRVAPSKPKAAMPQIGDRPKANRGGERSGSDE